MIPYMKKDKRYIIPPSLSESCLEGLVPKISVEVPDLTRVTAKEIREANAAIQKIIQKIWKPGEDGNIIEVDFKNY